MNDRENILSLITEGQRLLPLGGNMFDGYNGDHQAEFLSWRFQTIAALEEIGPAGKRLIDGIESDDNAKYLLTTSVQNILGALKGALVFIDRQITKTSVVMRSSEINTAWSPLRAVLENSFSFSNIKEIVGLAGIDLVGLAHLQQPKSSKGQLMAVLDSTLGALSEDKKRQFISIVTEEIIRRQPNVVDLLKDYLSRLGWSIRDGKIIPIEIFDPSDLPELPEESRLDLVKATQRLRDGDLSGAISSACGAVDAATSKIYRQNNLGDPGAASFQERVSNSIKSHGVLIHLDTDLQALGWDVTEIKPFKENLVKSLNQASYVMQTLRSNMGDVHGSKPILKPLVFDSLKWAALILRILT
jgi:hypothetical protein